MTSFKPKPKLSFTPLQDDQNDLVLGWLHKPHVSEWFRGQGLENTIQGIHTFLSDQPNWFDGWVGYADGVPFAFLMTFDVTAEDQEDPECHFGKWVDPDQKSITLDLLIGEEDYLGQGLGVPLIQEFLAQIHPDKGIIFIDPQCENTRAIHVYKKAGFKVLEEFIASWNPVPHVLMRLQHNARRTG